MNKLTAYINESMVELKKVSWPTQKQTQGYTILVLGISLGMAIYLGLVDTAFNYGLKLFLTRGL
ncbi:MAG: preprotein translocase subunit SecE [bacterium]